VNYIGSITVDEDLLDMAGLVAGENVLVVDHSNGARLETYVAVGERGSGTICMNGAAAHLINRKDTISVMAFTWTDKDVTPSIVAVDNDNRFARYQQV
jgi:aspartate 1-decarboxylase